MLKLQERPIRSAVDLKAVVVVFIEPIVAGILMLTESNLSVAAAAEREAILLYESAE